jgi:hypothetical protein
MAFVTVYSLFADDVRMVSFPKSWDATFDGITILCLCLFSVEIILFSIVIDEYFLSFYFWLDIVSSISLITDIQFMMERVTD